MGSFDAYLDEGVDLAVQLANLTSRQRQGTIVASGFTPSAGELRVAGAAAAQLSERVRSILLVSDVGRAAAMLNGLFGDYQAAPQLAADTQGRWRLHLHPHQATYETLDAVKAASGLAAMIDNEGWSNLKECAASRCDDIFVDRSRNSSRQYCSKTCGNRINAQNARQRRGPD